MQYGFYINSAKCTGCKTCQVSCKDEKNNPLAINFRRVYEYGGGEWQKKDQFWQNTTFSYYLSVACHHCDEPACLTDCPTGAIYKRDADGLVVINQDACLGCQQCAKSCPYDGTLQFNPQKKVMTKCDGCYERVAQGLNPVCVDACPQQALQFGEIKQLRHLYGHECNIAPLPLATLTKPNIVITPHKNARASGDTMGKIQNPEEL